MRTVTTSANRCPELPFETVTHVQRTALAGGLQGFRGPGTVSWKPACALGLGAIGCFAIQKLPNSHSSRLLSALADPVNAAIVDELFAVDRATPGALASSIQRSLGVSRPTISTHLTQLEERLVVERDLDGTISLTDREELATILQGARRLAKAALTQAANEESAAHYLAQRRINRPHSERPQPTQAIGPSDLARVGSMDIAAEISRIAESYSPDDTERDQVIRIALGQFLRSIEGQPSSEQCGRLTASDGP